MTVHQYEARDAIKEVHRVSGGNLGGGEVEKLFIDFLEKLFTKENIPQIKRERYSEWMKINKEFEKIKRSMETDPNNIFVSIETVSCPWDSCLLYTSPSPRDS